MAENPSIGVTFFGLSAKEQSLFKRVLVFMDKKGKPFHLCEAPSACLFVINNESTALEQAIQQQNQPVPSNPNSNRSIIACSVDALENPW